MTDLPAPPPPKPRRPPSAAVRWNRKARELRIIEGLRTGATTDALAERENVTPRRMRDIVNALLAAHPDLEPPDAFTQMRSARLDQAVEHALYEMGAGSPNASAQLLRVLREFERHAEIASLQSAKTSANSEP